MRTEWRAEPSRHDDFRSRYPQNVLWANLNPNTYVAVFWEVTPWTLVPTITRPHYPKTKKKKTKSTAVKTQNLVYKLMDFEKKKAVIHLSNFTVVKCLANLLHILGIHWTNFGPQTRYPEWGFNLRRSSTVWSSEEETVAQCLATGTDKQDSNSTSTELCYFNF